MTSEAPPLLELSQKRGRVLVIASIGVFIATLDSSILAVALPALAADIRLSFSEALWVQASYLLVVTVLLVPMGRWAQQRGYFYVYWLGNLLFGVFSVAAALAFNGPSMIAARVLQAVGAAFIITTSAAIVTAIYPRRARGRALGLNMMGATLGMTLGPPLGGVIVTHLGWPWIFWVKVPVAAATVIAGWSLLGAERRDRARMASSVDQTGIDIRGAALMAAMLAALFIPLTFSPLWGLYSLKTVLPLLGAAVLAGLFVYVEARTDDPILDLRLFKQSRVFTGAVAASFLFMAASYGVTIFTAVFLVVAQGRSAQFAGLVLLIQPAVMTLLAPLAGRVSDRMGSRGPSVVGMLLIAAGTGQLAFFSLSTSASRVVVALATLGLGIGLFSTPNFSAIMGSVNHSMLGVASGLFTAARFCGMGVSIAMLGAIAASKLGPEGGRVILLGTSVGIDNAEAFVAGFREAMWAGTAIALLGALVSLVREKKPGVRAAGRADVA